VNAPANHHAPTTASPGSLGRVTDVHTRSLSARECEAPVMLRAAVRASVAAGGAWAAWKAIEVCVQQDAVGGHERVDAGGKTILTLVLHHLPTTRSAHTHPHDGGIWSCRSLFTRPQSC
jgi:hypothetical protein